MFFHKKDNTIAQTNGQTDESADGQGDFYIIPLKKIDCLIKCTIFMYIEFEIYYQLNMLYLSDCELNNWIREGIYVLLMYWDLDFFFNLLVISSTQLRIYANKTYTFLTNKYKHVLEKTARKLCFLSFRVVSSTFP